MEIDMKTELKQNEKMIKQGAANLQKGPETVGGKLYLTNQRLVFEAHKMNFQGGTTEVGLSDVSSSQKCWTKFLGIIPLTPNSLAVFTTSGDEYRFVLFGRDAWESAIHANRQA
jgi:catechol-2,3-dioxygenase